MANEADLTAKIDCLDEVTTAPHFHKVSFRIKNKIFSTYDQKNDLLVVKLNPIDQDVFTKVTKGIVSPVPNKWGQQGWTQAILSEVTLELLEDLLSTAYTQVKSSK